MPAKVFRIFQAFGVSVRFLQIGLYVKKSRFFLNFAGLLWSEEMF